MTCTHLPGGANAARACKERLSSEERAEVVALVRRWRKGRRLENYGGLQLEWKRRQGRFDGGPHCLKRALSNRALRRRVVGRRAAGRPAVAAQPVPAV